MAADATSHTNSHDRIDELCAILSHFTDPQTQELVRKIRQTHRSVLPSMMSPVMILIRRAIDRVRDMADINRDRLTDLGDNMECEYTDLRNKRDLLDAIYSELEMLFRDASDILQNHLPSAAMSVLGLEFGQNILLDFYSLDNSERISARAQQSLFDSRVAVVHEIFEEFEEETASIVLAANELAGGVFRRPRRLIFRPPGYAPVRFFVVFDPYEQTRGAAVGSTLPGMLKPIRHTLFKAGKLLGVSPSLITAGFGLQSLGHSRRAQMRRELVTAAGEQIRRVLAAAMAQLHSFHREVNHQIRCAAIGYFNGHSVAYSQRLRELSVERRRSNKDAQTAERLLLSAERIAREIQTQSPPLALEEAR